MTAMFLKLLLFAELFAGVFSVTTLNKKQYLDCLKDYWESKYRGVERSKLDISPHIYLKTLPLCITKVRRTGRGSKSCDMAGPINELKGFFICLNNFNNGKNIQESGATALLYSGNDGRLKVESYKREHVAASTWSFGASATSGVMGKTIDTTIPALVSLWGESELRKTRNHRFWSDLACIWLVYNADMLEHDNTIINYQSLKGYETRYIEGHAEDNAGKPLLIQAGIKNAVIIGNFFWNAEAIAVAKKIELRDKPGDKQYAQLIVHMREYELTDTDPYAKPICWKEENLFGPLLDLRAFPVVFERDHVQYPVYKTDGRHEAPFRPKKVNLYELITIYNKNHDKIEDKIKVSLNNDVDKYIDFTLWTRKLKIKIFNKDRNIIGAWADAPDTFDSETFPAHIQSQDSLDEAYLWPSYRHDSMKSHEENSDLMAIDYSSDEKLKAKKAWVLTHSQTAGRDDMYDMYDEYYDSDGYYYDDDGEYYDGYDYDSDTDARVQRLVREYRNLKRYENQLKSVV